jgi:heme-degrading monooxygenase HmoA
MFARLGMWQGSAAELEQWIVRAREFVKPNLRQDAGLKTAYWLVDREGGKAMIVTLWESEEAMRASEQSRLKRQSTVAATTGAKVTTERYEVVDSLIMSS